MTIALWSLAWIVAFPFLYGWYTDDVDIFRRLVHASARGLVDPLFFHAYYWFIGIPLAAVRPSVPSYPVPLLEGAATGFFRSCIIVTLAIHVLVLVAVADFTRRVLPTERATLIAFVLFVVDPTLTFYAPLLDSRFVGLIAAIPAMSLLLSVVARSVEGLRLIGAAALSGLLMSIGTDMHYTTVYLVVPFAFAFWFWLGVDRGFGRRWSAALIAFGLGAGIYWAAVEVVHRLVMGVGGDPVAVLLLQRTKHLSPYSFSTDLRAYGGMFVSQMGWPMLCAIGASVAALCAMPKLRTFPIAVLVTTAVVGVVIIVTSGTMPFYRQFSGLQICFAILAAIGIEPLFAFDGRPAALAGALATLVVGWVPFSRSAEVYAAHQGLGRAIAAASALRPKSEIWFALEKYRREPFALRDFGRAGSHLDDLPHDALVVTDFLALTRDPFMLATLASTAPLAAFPTEWCTREQYAELQVYFGFERYQDERERCEARVYSVRSLLDTIGRNAAVPVRVAADSEINAKYRPSRVLDARNPLWVSAGSFERTHFLELTFPRPIPFGKMAIVSPEPNFGGGRFDELSIGSVDAGGIRELWHAGALGSRSVVVATWPTKPVRRVRLTIAAQNGQKPPFYGGVKIVTIPGVRLEAVR